MISIFDISTLKIFYFQRSLWFWVIIYLFWRWYRARSALSIPWCPCVFLSGTGRKVSTSTTNIEIVTYLVYDSYKTLIWLFICRYGIASYEKNINKTKLWDAYWMLTPGIDRVLPFPSPGVPCIFQADTERKNIFDVFESVIITTTSIWVFIYRYGVVSYVPLYTTKLSTMSFYFILFTSHRSSFFFFCQYTHFNMSSCRSSTSRRSSVCRSRCWNRAWYI